MRADGWLRRLYRKSRRLRKKADTARLQDELTGALIGLARAVDSTTAISKRTGQIIIEGLFTTVTNVNFDNASIESMIQKVRAEKERLAPDCSKCQSPCGKTDEYDMQQLWNANEDIRSLKSLILFEFVEWLHMHIMQMF